MEYKLTVATDKGEGIEWLNGIIVNEAENIRFKMKLMENYVKVILKKFLL